MNGKRPAVSAAFTDKHGLSRTHTDIAQSPCRSAAGADAKRFTVFFTVFAAAVLAVLCGAPPAKGKVTGTPATGNEPEGTVAFFTSNPRAHHREEIWAEGVISSTVKIRKHKGGPYTVFKIKDPVKEGGAMRVYLKGLHKELKKGDRLRVRGRFYEKRRYLFIGFKNVLKGKEFVVLKPH